MVKLSLRSSNAERSSKTKLYGAILGGKNMRTCSCLRSVPMQQEDRATSAVIMALIYDTVDEAIGTAKIQRSLRLAIEGDDDSYDAVVDSLRQGVQGILNTQFSSSNSDPAARFAAAITEEHEQLQRHLASFPEYQAICSLEAELVEQSKQKMNMYEQLKAKRMEARAREAAS